MINNKKGEMTQAIGVILMFSLFVIIFSLVAYFIFVAGNNYIAVPLTNITNVTNFDAMINTGIQAAGEEYQATNLDIIDYGIFAALVIMTCSGLMIAYYSRQLDYFSFLSMLTYGLMVLLFILGLIEIITDWFYDLIINLFPSLVIDLPILSWFLDNLGLYFLILVGTMFLINQIDFDLAVINKRKNKEFEEDEVV
jgi:hypothetical protein